MTVSGNQVTNSDRGIDVFRGTNVIISGNTVSANQTGIYVSYGGSTVSIDTNDIIQNNAAAAPTAIGIYLEGASAVVNNNMVTEARIDDA